MHLKTKIFGIVSVLLLFGGVTFAVSPQISVANSIAGEDIDLRISGLFTNENIDINIARPGQNSILFSTQADEFGIVRSVLHNLHFQTAGNYSINVLRGTESASQDFQVFAGPVSAYRSSVEFQDKSVEADGETQARFSIVLRDAFGNPVQGEPVRVFSTRNEDAVIAEGKSDEWGLVNGKISSRTPGISTVSVLGGDTLLFTKPEVVFFLSDSPLNNVGASDESFGEYLKAQLFDDEGGADVAYFTIENMKTDVTIGQNVTAKIVARDQEGQVVPTFRGTVRFSSSDDRADLPTDYRFTSEDQGEHSFFLSFTFQTPGTQTLAVHDLADFRRAGEIELNVTLGGGNIQIPSGDESITLITPRPGTYRSARVTITGESKKCDAINLTDGPTVLTTGLAVDARGNFLYQTPKLGDGIHVFKAICTDSTQLVSNELTVRIDQTPPQNISILVDPTGELQKGQAFTVTITADEPLSGANSIFRGVLTAHQMKGAAFVAQLTAPQECGEFPLDANAADILGNQKDFPNAALITVSGCDGVVEEPTGDSVAPTAVTNLSTESGDGKVTLFWSPAKDDSGVTNYRVDFGDAETCEGDFNMVPDNRTQWYVDGLSDDQEYCFCVVAIDGMGNESPCSEKVYAMTAGAHDNMYTSAPQPDQLEKSGSSTPFWPVVIAILAGGGILILSRRRAT